MRIRPPRVALAFVGGVGLALLLALSAPADGAGRDITVAPTRGEARLALVVGNATYPSAPLRNPANDARAMAQALRGLGFEVLAHENVGQKALLRAIIEFGDRLQGGGVGLFFYAGHGIQVGGRNYLIPVDAAIRSEAEVEVEAVDVARVLARMETAKNRLNVVILDACRDNPFGRSFRSSARGLASIDAPSGTILAYATAPGKTARDGEGTNGLYTGELLKAMQVPGLKIEDVFKRVRDALQRQTQGEQVPWESSSLVGDFIFKLAAEGPAPQAPSPDPRVAVAPVVREEPRQAFGSLAISAKTPGVEVWLGDQRVGETNAGRALVVDNLRVGTHRVRGRKAGQQDWEREVQVVADARTEVLIDLDPPGPPPVIKGDYGAERVLIPTVEFWMGDQRPRWGGAGPVPGRGVPDGQRPRRPTRGR